MSDTAPRAGADACADVPMPPSHHGIVWEPLAPAHHPALATLFARMEARDNPPYRTSPGEVAEMLGGATQWSGIAGFATRGLAAGRSPSATPGASSACAAGEWTPTSGASAWEGPSSTGRRGRPAP